MLSALQRKVLAAFDRLHASASFALAGGAALIIHGVVNRATKDLDLFGAGGAAPKDRPTRTACDREDRQAAMPTARRITTAAAKPTSTTSQPAGSDEPSPAGTPPGTGPATTPSDTGAVHSTSSTVSG